jgi:hypothetical protein
MTIQPYVRLFQVWVCFVSLTSCVLHGPSYEQLPNIPTNNTNHSTETVIVSGFLGSRHEVSATYSQDIAYINEAVRTTDISPQIANILNNNGVRAEARKEFTQGMLQDNQVLLTGVFRVSGSGQPMSELTGTNMLNLYAMILTVAVVGYVIPSPFPWKGRISIFYNVNVTDNTGRYLLSTGDQFSKAIYETRWAVGFNGKEPNTMTYQDFMLLLGNSLSEWFLADKEEASLF